MTKKEFSDTELERMSIYWGNPLLDGDRLKGSLAINTDRSEIRIGDGADSVDLKGVMLLEGQEYTKLFVGIETRALISSLSPRGSHLLLWLMLKVIRRHDLIWIDRKQYMLDSGISRSETCMSAIVDLVFSRVLVKAPQYSGLYFINPHIFFKGNRLQKYKSYLSPDNIRHSKKLNINN